MPNDCVNHLTITSSSESDMKEMLESDMKSINVVINQTGKKGVRCTIKTAWKPDYVWLEKLMKQYPSCWIKNEWISEDGTAGVWVAYNNEIKKMKWDDLSIEDEHYYFN
jgi:hypothetical protein